MKGRVFEYAYLDKGGHIYLDKELIPYFTGVKLVACSIDEKEFIFIKFTSPTACKYITENPGTWFEAGVSPSPGETMWNSIHGQFDRAGKDWREPRRKNVELQKA